MHGLHFALEHLARGDPLFVGEAPSAHGDPEKPLTGNVGRRLAAAAGLGFPAPFLRRFGRVNLLQEFPGYANGRGGGAAFPVEEGMAEALLLLDQIRVDRELRMGRPAPEPMLLMLGRRVAASFSRWCDVDLEELAWFERRELVCCIRGDSAFEKELTGFQFAAAVLPHPSSLSRWWNDSANCAAARAFFLALRAPGVERGARPA